MGAVPRRKRTTAPAAGDIEPIVLSRSRYVRIPLLEGVSSIAPLITKASLHDENEGAPDAIIHVGGCDRAVHLMYDRKIGCFIITCADCNRLIGAIRLMSEG